MPAHETTGNEAPPLLPGYTTTVDNITYQVLGGSGPERPRVRKAPSICGKAAPVNNKQNQQAEPPVSPLAEPVTPWLSSPSLLVRAGKGRYLGNTSHLSGNCSCGRSRNKTLGFSSLREWSLSALPQETSCHQVDVPHQEVWLGMYWKCSSQGLGGGPTARLPAAASEARVHTSTHAPRHLSRVL